MLKNHILFVEVYEKHIKSMGLEQKWKHKKENIVKVERDFEFECLNVYFENNYWREWYRYFPNGTWG